MKTLKENYEFCSWLYHCYFLFPFALYVEAVITGPYPSDEDIAYGVAKRIHKYAHEPWYETCFRIVNPMNLMFLLLATILTILVFIPWFPICVLHDNYSIARVLSTSAFNYLHEKFEKCGEIIFPQKQPAPIEEDVKKKESNLLLFAAAIVGPAVGYFVLAREAHEPWMYPLHIVAIPVIAAYTIVATAVVAPFALLYGLCKLVAAPFVCCFKNRNRPVNIERNVKITSETTPIKFTEQSEIKQEKKFTNKLWSPLKETEEDDIQFHTAYYRRT